MECTAPDLLVERVNAGLKSKFNDAAFGQRRVFQCVEREPPWGAMSAQPETQSQQGPSRATSSAKLSGTSGSLAQICRRRTLNLFRTAGCRSIRFITFQLLFAHRLKQQPVISGLFSLKPLVCYLLAPCRRSIILPLILPLVLPLVLPLTSAI